MRHAGRHDGVVSLAPRPGVPGEGRLIGAVGAGLIVSGMFLGVAGFAVGMLVIGVGLFLVGFADARLTLLCAIVLMPALTALHGNVLTTIDGSSLDGRLLLTGATCIVFGAWLILRRPSLNRASLVFLALVALVAGGILLNREAPLMALPAIARFATYAFAFLLARRTLGSEQGVLWTLIAIALGALVPAASGLGQLLAGQALDQNGAARLSGVYSTSPVGLALEMQLALVAVAVMGLWRAPRSRSWQAVLVATAVISAVVLVSTATRLVFVSAVVGLLVLAGASRVWRLIPVVLVAVAVSFVVQPGLLDRIVTSGQPPMASAQPESSRPAPSGIPAAVSSAPWSSAPAGEGLETTGDASLRFRMYLWAVAIDEWSRAPILGRGTGTFATIVEHRSGLKRIAPHNDYLGILFENGVVGLGLYLALQATVLLTLGRYWLRSARDPARCRLFAGIACAFVTLNVANVINNALLFIDLQVAIWTLVGATLEYGAGDPPPHIPQDLA